MSDNVIHLNDKFDDALAAELTRWLLDKHMPISEAHPIVKRTLQKLSPLRGLSLKVKLVPESDPSKMINLSETLTEGITDALSPIIREMAYDRIALELELWNTRRDLGE